jgi:hypothetical protein
MKKISTFLAQNPSYVRWGSERLAEKANVALSTVNKFKKTEEYKQIKDTYNSKTK